MSEETDQKGLSHPCGKLPSGQTCEIENMSPGREHFMFFAYFKMNLSCG